MKASQRWLMALCLASISATAQQVEENLSSEKKRLEQSEKQHWTATADRIQKHFMDSLSQSIARRKTFSFVDSWGHVYKAVPSEKWLSSLSDSLHLDRFQDLPEMKIVSQGELIQHIRQDFLSGSEKNIPIEKTTKGMGNNIMPHVLERSNISTIGDSLQRSAQSAKSQVANFRLPGAEQAALKPLMGKLVQSPWLHVLDSFRHLHLKEQRLRLDTLPLKENVSMIKFREKQSFWQKTYKELLVGMSSRNFKTFQFAPALACNVVHPVSAGIGPSLLFRQVDTNENKKPYTLQWSVRSFVKAQLLKQHAYGQIEDNWQPTRQGAAGSCHSVLAGGGYLLALSSKVALNMAMFYKVYSGPASQPSTNPFVIRLGISSIQLKH